MRGFRSTAIICVLFISSTLLLPSFGLAQERKTIVAVPIESESSTSTPQRTTPPPQTPSEPVAPPATSNTKAQLFFSSRSGTYTQGSTFEVPVFLNTRGASINAVELHINFDPRKIAIVKPTNDKSIIAIWLEPPTYSNTQGTAKIIGGIPNGIVTSSGMVTSITFKALESGEASIRISENSLVLANDGRGTNLLSQYDRMSLTIVPQPPQGVRVFSETHPFNDQWYNNNSPVLAWETEAGVTAFSYSLDNEPFTIPDNVAEATTTVKSYENLDDGIWYFHIKARKKDVWGATTHFIVRIDTTAPAEFKPILGKINNAGNENFVTFTTTDNLSGVDHYEIGIQEKETATPDATPLFVQTESPYQIPQTLTGDTLVTVKAYDRAGNVVTVTSTITIGFSLIKFMREHSLAFALGFIALFLLYSMLHYLVRHHLAHRLKRAFDYLRSEKEEMEDVVPQHSLHSDHIPSPFVEEHHQETTNTEQHQQTNNDSSPEGTI
ncbi:MAG: hypothetical protein K0S38_122 [Candidatus Paceibacter sp.]|jgi:hypothetical protein|nr:hypothetical protein [Candidatus Paceibacter sp.]